MILEESVKKEVKNQLETMKEPVTLTVFTQQFECGFCRETRTLAEETAALSDLILIEILDFIEHEDRAKSMGIDKIPAIAVSAKEDYSIKFYGIPGGYEFSSFLEAIRLVSTGNHGLSRNTLDTLKTLSKPVHLKVFVTPTCPYCPRAVILAHKMAAASPLVKADMIEATEFPELANKYSVMGVPKTVINETVFIEGAVPESVLLEKILEAVRA
ncbi:MAG: glutaredoxin [Spirochaetales bacterium]|nr:MAG: glutaredoxin [Spirochaetales bacterium]